MIGTLRPTPLGLWDWEWAISGDVGRDQRWSVDGHGIAKFASWLINQCVSVSVDG